MSQPVQEAALAVKVELDDHRAVIAQVAPIRIGAHLD